MVAKLTAHERKRALEALLQSSGWSILREVIASQVHNRIQQLVLTPLETLDQSLAQEYAKGETASLQLVLEMPKTLFEQASEEVLEANEKELANDDDSDTSSIDYPEDTEDWTR